MGNVNISQGILHILIRVLCILFKMEAQITSSTNIHDEEKFSGGLETKHEENARELSDNSEEEDHEHEPPVCPQLDILQQEEVALIIGQKTPDIAL